MYTALLLASWLQHVHCCCSVQHALQPPDITFSTFLYIPHWLSFVKLVRLNTALLLQVQSKNCWNLWQNVTAIKHSPAFRTLSRPSPTSAWRFSPLKLPNPEAKIFLNVLWGRKIVAKKTPSCMRKLCRKPHLREHKIVNDFFIGQRSKVRGEIECPFSISNSNAHLQWSIQMSSVPFHLPHTPCACIAGSTNAMYMYCWIYQRDVYVLRVIQMNHSWPRSPLSKLRLQ